MIKILSERKYNAGISRQVVYEWEEDISVAYNVPMAYLDSYKKHPVARILRKMKCSKPIPWKRNKDIYLFFAMNIDILRLLTWSYSNVIPILLDVTLDEVDELYKLTVKLPVFWVTSFKIYEILLDQHPTCKARYIPQMASDRYLSEAVKKDISFIQFGRRNPVLHKYALQYCDTHLGASYIYRDDNPQNGMIQYKDSVFTEMGVISNRKDFINYLLRSKISLCSSPMMDETRDFGAGIDFLTARWYESIMCRCNIIARVSSIVRKEINNIKLEQLIRDVSAYEEFENIADDFINEGCLSFENAKDFSMLNSAQNRGKEILGILREMVDDII